MAKEAFTEAEQAEIRKAIQQAEKQTSGEVKVHIENSCKGDALDRAAFVFEQLEMHKTELRNGVLFYLAVKDRKFAILGDAGINQKVPEGFWDDISNKMMALFKTGKFVDGLVHGVREAGNQLKSHFPYQTDDVNELSDDISFGKNK